MDFLLYFVLDIAAGEGVCDSRCGQGAVKLAENGFFVIFCP